MTKSKKTKIKLSQDNAGASGASGASTFSVPDLLASPVSDLRHDAQLWYRILVLLYDLRSLNKDYNSQKRTLCTTDELYLSTPYFTPSEAARIKSTLTKAPKNAAEENTADDDEQHAETQTIEAYIKVCLANFFEKRKASGDARPCGPHDMAPIYQRAFGIETAELQDERFLSRLRRSGLNT
jgi:hypothetical protein